MDKYGVTKEGFVLKRMDNILDEIHEDLTEGFGVDTRFSTPSFLDILVTTFSNQLAELWEVAQESYYAKYPATASGINLDNAVQYGGIKRVPSKRTSYLLHCTGDDGAYIREGVIVATNTMPEKRLYSAEEFQITREKFNSVSIKVATIQPNSIYAITINGNQYSYLSGRSSQEIDIAYGLKEVIKDSEFDVYIENGILIIDDKNKNKSNILLLSDNLTTISVTTIANFITYDYGRINIPNGLITRMINNVSGFRSVNNLISPKYGREEENDIELRKSYIAKSALRSNTMIESIVSEILNNVKNVESALGYENDSDEVDIRGLPPHSIEIVVEGGNESEIGEAILRRKAGGIQTYGKIKVEVPGNYGDIIPIRFNRPDYLYAWIKVILHGDIEVLPVNYATLTIQALIEYYRGMVAGEKLLIQLMHEGIYDKVAGLTYIEIKTAYSTDKSFVPKDNEYKLENILVNSRQKILIDETRIEVRFNDNNI